MFGELDPDTVVLTAATYRGPFPIPGRIGDSTHEATKATVIVNEPDRPVLLIVTAYDHVLWRIGRTPDTDIVGVMVAGYHDQGATGVEATTPVRFASYEGPSDFPYFFFPGPSEELLAANRVVAAMTGHEIGTVVTDLSDDDAFHLGQPLAPGAAVLFGGDAETADFVDVDSPPTGQAGIDVLLAEGSIRPATIADMEIWLEVHNEQFAQFDTAVEVDWATELWIQDHYVVVEPVTLPGGLFGANAVAFLIPKGMPTPDGPHDHNTFYWMEDGSTTTPLD